MTHEAQQKEGDEMEEDKIIKIVGRSATPYALMNSLLTSAAVRDSKLTTEQKADRIEKRRLIREEEIRQAKIIKNICPDCDCKLIRGKRDKRNGYKRLWTCKECGNSHTA